MLATQDMLALIERAGIAAIRAKSVALTEFAIEISDKVLDPLGVHSARLGTRRGGEVTSRWTILSFAWRQLGSGSGA
jgi:kynureninase